MPLPRLRREIEQLHRQTSLEITAEAKGGVGPRIHESPMNLLRHGKVELGVSISKSTQNLGIQLKQPGRADCLCRDNVARTHQGSQADNAAYPDVSMCDSSTVG